MFKHKLFLAVVVIGIAAIAGVVAGRHIGLAAGVAKAGEPKYLADGPSPEWKDLSVAYVVAPDGTASNEIFHPAIVAAKINAQIAHNVDEAMMYSRSQRLDVVIIDKPMLESVDPAWAADQFRRGTAFVGFNLTPKELGTLIGDLPFASNEYWATVTYPEPFVSFRLLRVIGNPEHVRQLEELNALYPVNEVNAQARIRLGIDDVDLIGVEFYTDVTAENLVNFLDNIRINIDNNANVVTWGGR